MGQKHEGSQQDRKKQAVTTVMCRTGLCLGREGLSTQGHCALRSLLHVKKQRKDGAVHISGSQAASSHQQRLSPSAGRSKQGLQCLEKATHLPGSAPGPGVPPPGTLSPPLCSPLPHSANPYGPFCEHSCQPPPKSLCWHPIHFHQKAYRKL